MKRLLVFSLSYAPYPMGGAEIAIKEITDRINPSDIEFHMVTLKFDRSAPDEEQIGHMRVHRIGVGSHFGSMLGEARALYLSKILFIPHAALFGLQLQRRHGYSGLWAMMSYMALPIVLMRFAGVRVPYVISLQEGDSFAHMFERARIAPIRPLIREAFRNARVVQTISNFLALWPRRLGFGGDAIVIPNGVDVERFSVEVSPKALIDIKDSLGKRMGDIFLVTTSRLVPKNGLADVIDALPNLPEHVKFVIVGDGELRNVLRMQAEKLHVGKRVIFVGHVSHDELPLYLHACDIFVRPSLSEGMGNSFVEAMAAGLPVIATQEGGIADFLFDKKRNPDKPVTGWAVDARSPQQVAEAVRDIIDHPEQVRAVTATAKVLVSEKYDWKTVAHDMHSRAFNSLWA